MNFLPELMDLQAAADWLQLSPRTVLRKTAAGELPGFRRIGRASRWSSSILRAWVLRGCPVDAEGFELQIRAAAFCQELPPLAIHENGLEGERPAGNTGPGGSIQDNDREGFQ
jgi:predicted DNA-binding transcriptional regulator AlpA